MKLSKRLQTIADQIPNGYNLIDIGCDHGLLDIYMALQRSNIQIVASDISENAIRNAKRMALEYGATSSINFQICDGLSNICITKKDVIVMAGMGARTMIDIIKRATLAENTLILSAHTDISLLRKEICAMGYYIKNEVAIFDKKWYFIITFEVGNQVYDEIDYEIGPFARHQQEYIEHLLQKEKNISTKKKCKTKTMLLLEKMVL